jgi:hypothetical protein
MDCPVIGELFTALAFLNANDMVFIESTDGSAQISHLRESCGSESVPIYFLKALFEQFLRLVGESVSRRRR